MATLDPRDDALVRRRVLALAAVAVLVLDGDVALGAVEDDLLLLGRQRAPRGVHVDAGIGGDRVQHPREVLGVGAAPRGDGPVVQGQVRVGDDELGVDLERRAEAVAGRAGAVGRVEREVARRRLFEAAAVDGAHEVLAEREQIVVGGGLALPAHDLQLGHPVGQLQGGLQRVGEPAVDALAHDQAVDDDLDRVLLVAGQALGALQELVDVDDLAVDPGAHEALPGEVLEQRLVLALAAAHDRRQHLEPSALGEQEHAIDDLLRRLAAEPGAVLRAVLDADAGVQQPEVVVDLGDRADRRAGVAAGRLLVDRDGRRQPLDDVDVGLVHLPEELAGVGRQRLDVAPLALGVDRVEGQARLARSREAGEHDQLVAGQFDVDVLEVVLPRATDRDRRCGGAGRGSGGARRHQPTNLPRNNIGGILDHETNTRLTYWRSGERLTDRYARRIRRAIELSQYRLACERDARCYDEKPALRRAAAHRTPS